MFIRSAYNYDRDAESLASALECKDASLTRQEFAEECDINTIVRRFGLTGEVPVNVRMPMHGDFQELVTFQDAMNALISAQKAFEQMPANVRARFGNDPGVFVDFCSDPANVDEAIKLGLIRDDVVEIRNKVAADKAAQLEAAKIKAAIEADRLLRQGT